MELFDCAINEKCCSVDGGRGICPFFFVPTKRDLTAKKSSSPEICHPMQKNANARGLVRGGGGKAQVELTDALF